MIISKQKIAQQSGQNFTLYFLTELSLSRLWRKKLDYEYKLFDSSIQKAQCIAEFSKTDLSLSFYQMRLALYQAEKESYFLYVFSVIIVDSTFKIVSSIL